MDAKRKGKRTSLGRPPTGNGEAQVAVRGPAALLGAVEAKAKQQGMSVAEAWRRAARLWLDSSAAKVRRGE